ncbi:hypothetical protein CPB83DRAFT_861380 [Crepidotus variabilis]|uniref:Uncharacterized protein n=1 Tax=Crepidotus variabilis TaxID=179855 RepID=A0A9P6E7X9_9AGAR|nr:hypothetical protein CPB83DRAFT_861380 [Crepidotus variabilis]
MVTTPYDALSSGDSDKAIALLIANPNLATIYEFTQAFEQLCMKHPDKINIFASTLSSASQSDRISQFTICDADETLNEPFDGVFRREIYETIKRLLYTTADTSIIPSDKYIIASLISGVAILTNLCISDVQLIEIAQGLHFPRSKYREIFGEKKDEIKALGACIQVLVAGAVIYDGSEGRFTKQELKGRIPEVKRLMKHPTAIKVMEAVHRQLSTDESKSHTAGEVWQLMFPKAAE